MTTTPTQIPAHRLAAQAALEEECARRRAAFMRQADPQQIASTMEQWEQRHQRQQRARDALRRQARSPLPTIRQNAQPPEPSIIWAKAVSLDPARDQRLCPGAFRTLLVLRALTQKGEALTKAGVAAVIGITARTVQRHLRQLEFAGYIMTQTARNGLGSAIGLVVDLTEAVLPTFMRSKPAKSLENGGKPAETIPPSNNRNSSSRDIDAALAALPDGLRAILERLRPRPAG